MLIKARHLYLPFDIQTKLFESIVCPIFLYGSEAWGFPNHSKTDTLHTKLYDLQVSVDKQRIAYWLRVLNKDVHNFAYMVYMTALNLFRRDEYTSQWLKRVKYILDSCGLTYMSYNQHEILTKQCNVIIHRRIKATALKTWNTYISTSSICRMYRFFFNNSILKTVCYIQIAEIEFHYQS